MIRRAFIALRLAERKCSRKRLRRPIRHMTAHSLPASQHSERQFRARPSAGGRQTNWHVRCLVTGAPIAARKEIRIKPLDTPFASLFWAVRFLCRHVLYLGIVIPLILVAAFY